MSKVAMRLDGEPADVDAVLEALQAAGAHVEVSLSGRKRSRNTPGKIIQYGRLAPTEDQQPQPEQPPQSTVAGTGGGLR